MSGSESEAGSAIEETARALDAAGPHREDARADEALIAEALTSSSSSIRARAAETAGRFPGSERLGAALLRLLDTEPELGVRGAILGALGAILEAGDLGLGLSSLEEPSPRRVRKVRGRLIALLSDEKADKELRAAALEALACEAGSAEVRPHAEVFARSLSHRDRRAALRAMGRSGDRGFAGAVLRAFDDGDDAARAQAFIAAGRLGLEAAEARLIEAALRGREATREAALAGLAALGSPGARRALERAARGPEAERALAFLDELSFIEELIASEPHQA